MSANWYYRSGLKVHGPFTFDDLRKEVEEGRLRSYDELRDSDDGEWFPAEVNVTLFPESTDDGLEELTSLDDLTLDSVEEVPPPPEKPTAKTPAVAKPVPPRTQPVADSSPAASSPAPPKSSPSTSNPSPAPSGPRTGAPPPARPKRDPAQRPVVRNPAPPVATEAPVAAEAKVATEPAPTEPTPPEPVETPKPTPPPSSPATATASPSVATATPPIGATAGRPAPPKLSKPKKGPKPKREWPKFSFESDSALTSPPMLIFLGVLALAIGAWYVLPMLGGGDYEEEHAQLLAHYQEFVKLRTGSASQAEWSGLADQVRSAYDEKRKLMRKEIKPGDKTGKNILWAMDEMTRMVNTERESDENIDTAEWAFRTFLETAGEEMGLETPLPPAAAAPQESDGDGPNPMPTDSR